MEKKFKPSGAKNVGSFKPGEGEKSSGNFEPMHEKTVEHPSGHMEGNGEKTEMARDGKSFYHSIQHSKGKKTEAVRTVHHHGKY